MGYRFSRAQETLFALIAENLFGKPFSPSADTDWVEVYAESRLQTVTPLVFRNCQALPIDAKLSQRLKDISQKFIVYNVYNFNSHAHLHTLMSKAGISYCVLKGIASAHYYPLAHTRTMGDVDFYVCPSDVERAEQVLEADGFIPDIKEQVHHQVYRKSRMHFELHREVAGVPEGRAGEIIRGYLSDLGITVVRMVDGSVTYNSPTPFHHGLVLLLHMQHHLLSEGIGLRHLCDWAVFASHWSETEFTELFKEKLQTVGLWTFAKTLSLAAVRHLGAPYRAWMGEDCDLADALMADIMAGGNFGRKDNNRSYEGMLISNRGKDGVKKSMIRQGIASMNRVISASWPIITKLPFLYPIGWIFFTLRYLVRVLLNKSKKPEVIRTVKNSNKRKKLYSRLRLYEIEEEKAL